LAGKEAEKRHTAAADMLHLVTKPSFYKCKIDIHTLTFTIIS